MHRRVKSKLQNSTKKLALKSYKQKHSFYKCQIRWAFKDAFVPSDNFIWKYRDSCNSSCLINFYLSYSPCISLNRTCCNTFKFHIENLLRFPWRFLCTRQYLLIILQWTFSHSRLGIIYVLLLLGFFVVSMGCIT